MNITKAVIPAAGLGTRFLPYTKSVPKELVPIMGKPAIQMIVEEGIKSGITSFNIIANKDKHAIIDYFSNNPHLNEHLQTIGKENLIANINHIINTTCFNYIPQPQPLGLGHAVLMAEKAIGNEYFGIFLPDEIMFGDIPSLFQLIEIAKKYNSSVIAVQEVPHHTVASYGIVAIKKELTSDLFEIDHLVEKPAIESAPSNLAIIGRYILSPDIFSALKTVQAGAGNEIQLTDGITALMKAGEPVLAYKIKNIRHDIGNPIGCLQANIYSALSNPTTSTIIKKYIDTVTASI